MNDYLKPYWDTHPADRAELRALISEGRVEIVGCCGRPRACRCATANGSRTSPCSSRYWLHNTGTAPLGDAPYTATCDGAPSAATVTLASHAGAGGPVALEVRAPDGWHTSWTRRVADLDPGGHERIPLSVAPAGGAAPGEHLVRILAATPAGSSRTC